jgi:hypothetical protein
MAIFSGPGSRRTAHYASQGNGRRRKFSWRASSTRWKPPEKTTPGYPGSGASSNKSPQGCGAPQRRSHSAVLAGTC